MNILIADSHPIISKMLCLKLRKAGYNAQIAPDGVQAMKLFNNKQPDLVITDLLLPFVSGSELIVHIREKLSSQVPIIVLSNIKLENTIVEVFNLGADDYITKPFMPDEIVARTKRLLRLAA